MTVDQTQLKLRKLELLKEKKRLQALLPHKYGFKRYEWQADFERTPAKMKILVAANQIGKSTIHIADVIEWATNKELWPKLWPDLPPGKLPSPFWYLYPSRDVATSEFHTKWINDLLPRGEYRESHPDYKWKHVIKDKGIKEITFGTGVTIYFKTYHQHVQDLQAGTVYRLACDEELPYELYPELSMRVAGTNGYMSFVFTATMGQEFWREAIEVKGPKERFKGAHKTQVSMYDCQEFADGTKSHWTNERIGEVKANCATEKEVLRRVYGRFIVDDGLKYPSFSLEKNFKEYHPLPKDWLIYSGVDIGSGGDKGHPSAILFVGVSPDFTKGRVFLGWRGDGIQTTSSDVVNKYIELKGSMKPVAQYYDWANKDFSTISTRMGEVFQPAEKGHDKGEQVLNTLFKTEMLHIYDTPELQKLKYELLALKKETNKKDAKDDFTDALRYAVTQIPWDFSKVSLNLPKAKKKQQQMSEEEKWRRGLLDDEVLEAFNQKDIEHEIQDLNDLAGESYD